MSNPFTTPAPPPEQQLKNVAHILLRYCVVKRKGSGEGKRPIYEADCEAIRDTGVQLAEMVLAYLQESAEHGRERKANRELLKAAKEVLDNPVDYVDYIALDDLRRAIAKVEVFV